MELVTVLLLSEVRSSGSESPSEVTRSEHGWRIEDKTTTRTYDKVTSGPLHAHYPMGTGHGPKGSRSPRECTDGVAHLLATGFAKPTGTQLFVRPAHPDATWSDSMRRPSRTASPVRVFFLFSVGVRNHWLGVIPRGPFDPMSHYLYLPGHP
jgi:hypothetical protein